MKTMSLIAVTVMLAASPAFALRVTNLDTVPQTVELSGGGQHERRTIQPNDTEYFTGDSYGRLSIIPANAPKGKTRPAEDSTVHADGLLSGIIGAERNTDIPTDPDSDYAIWPGGKLQVQRNRRTGGKAF